MDFDATGLMLRALMLGEWTEPDGPHREGPPWRSLSTNRSRDELVLPAAGLDALRGLVAQVRDARVAGLQAEGEQVAVIALFAGDSGTGKTLAAQVVAAELRMPILEVDTPALDRGVAAMAAGLWSIFREGQRTGAVLCFHDAGAYLNPERDRQGHPASRSDPVDLPTRCARYPGLAIICSRVRPPADPTWRQRFSTVIEFPFPDAPAREQLWRRALPPQSETTSAELAFVARAFRLPGSRIQALAAAAGQMASQEGRMPTRADLVRALEQHYEKALASQATQAALAQLAGGGELSPGPMAPGPEPANEPEQGSSLLGRLRRPRRES